MKALNSLVGTGALIRLILRRDRLVLLAWVVGFALYRNRCCCCCTRHLSWRPGPPGVRQ